MKRKIARYLLLVPLSLVVLLIIATMTRKAHTEVEAERIRTLPELVLTDWNGIEFNTLDLTSGPLLITFFHPECDHCRYEISSLLMAELKNRSFNILLVSYADTSETRSSIQGLRIADIKHIHIIHDPEFKMSDLFGAEIIPTNFIYNDSLRLVKVLKGVVKPETIMKYLYGSN